jgi:hypothetical protein
MQRLDDTTASVDHRGRRRARPELKHLVLTVRGYGPLGFHGAGITPKQRFLDSIGDTEVAGNLLTAHVHCAFALSFLIISWAILYTRE